MEEVINLLNDVGDYKLITWLGQNLYELNGENSIATLLDHQMELNELQEGQFLVSVFKKQWARENGSLRIITYCKAEFSLSISDSLNFNFGFASLFASEI